MKAGCLALIAVVVLGGAVASFLIWRHFHSLAPGYLAEPVQRMDIESMVTTLGHISENRDTIEASVSEGDIFKLHPGQPVGFELVAVPDSHFEGTVHEIKAMPIAAFAATAANAKKSSGEGAQTGGPDADPPDGVQANEPADMAKAMSEPSQKRDIFSSGGEGVFYKVIFDMGQTAGRYPAGMSVMTHVRLGMARQIPAISIAALGKALSPDHYEVEVLDSRSRIVSRQITTGISDTLSIEVKSGLQVGDKVVIRESNDLYAPGYRG